MKRVDQMAIKDIPSKYVPFELPICETHNVLTLHSYTRKQPDETRRVLRVTRTCRCPVCHKQGREDIKIVDSRRFP